MSDISDWVTDASAFLTGASLLTTTWIVHVWAAVFPLVTAATAAMAFIITVHSFARLVRRWLHRIEGEINTSDDE